MVRIAARGVLLVAALLAACAGGKGGDDGGSCPAGSVAGVHPSTVRVTAGGQPVSFGGGATNCQEMSRWSLTGPGSIDRLEGVPVLYTPPATVAAVTTATLNLTVGGLTASAIITIDPASQELAGRVISAGGAPISGAVVRVGLASATTDASGAFSISGVVSPYELTVTSPDDLITSLYPELWRMDPTLTLFDVAASYPRGANVSGALSGGAGFPLPAGHQAGVAFRSPEAAAVSGIQDAASGYLVSVGWAAGASVTGELHALQWLVDADGRPVSYDGAAEGTAVTLTDQVALTGRDLALGGVATNSVSGTIVNTAHRRLGLDQPVRHLRRRRPAPDPAEDRAIPQPFPYVGFTVDLQPGDAGHPRRRRRPGVPAGLRRWRLPGVPPARAAPQRLRREHPVRRAPHPGQAGVRRGGGAGGDVQLVRHPRPPGLRGVVPWTTRPAGLRRLHHRAAR